MARRSLDEIMRTPINTQTRRPLDEIMRGQTDTATATLERPPLDEIMRREPEELLADLKQKKADAEEAALKEKRVPVEDARLGETIAKLEREITAPTPLEKTVKTTVAAVSDTKTTTEVSPEEKIATAVADKLERGESLGNNLEFSKIGEEAYGTTRGQSGRLAKDEYDAMELGVNKYIERRGYNPSAADVNQAKTDLADIESGILSKLPNTQQTRSGEQQQLQQFSTPPNISEDGQRRFVV